MAAAMPQCDRAILRHGVCFQRGRRRICHGVATVRDFSGHAGGGGPLRISMAFACVFAAVSRGGCDGSRHGRMQPGGGRYGDGACVADGRTLTLTDGREVRLAGIEVPRRARRGGAGGAGKARGRAGHPAVRRWARTPTAMAGSPAGSIQQRTASRSSWNCSTKGHGLVAANVGGTRLRCRFFARGTGRPSGWRWPLGGPHIIVAKDAGDPGRDPGAFGAVSPWSRATCCRSAKAAARSTSISAGAGRKTSPSRR